MSASPGAAPGPAGVPAWLSLVTLGVDDLSRARAFYAALGWVESSVSNTDVAFFHNAGAVLSLYGRQALAADAGVSPDGAGFRRISLAINLPSETAVDLAFVAWAAAGGTVVKPPERVFWGGYSGYGTDPDGHLWEMAYNPGLPLSSHGRVTLPT